MGAVVATAIDVGFRHIDTAPLHKNEKEIGAALNKQIQDKKVERFAYKGTSALKRSA